MKIVFVVDDFSGGAGKIAQILASEFAKRNQVSLLLARRQSSQRYLDSQITVRDILSSKPMTSRNLFQSIVAVRQYLTAEKPDIVISFIHNINIVVGLAMIGLKIPLIVSERGDPVRVKLPLFWKVLRLAAYARANKIVVLFDHFHHFARARYQNKCVTIPNPVVSPPTTKSLEDHHDKRPFTFVTLARLSQVKRLDLMLSLFSQFNLVFPNSRLQIIGDGKERESLGKLTAALNLESSVEFCGNQQDVYTALVHSDVYLMTSKHEGFPNALIEAMSVGLPVIAFKCHDGLEEIVSTGYNGFLIPEGDRDGFIQAMLALAHDKSRYQAVSLQARKLISQYSFDMIYQKWDNLVSELLTIN